MNALEDTEFRDFVAARSSALLRTAYLLTGDRQLAEDLVQSALEKTVRHWRSIRARGAVEAYVRTAMYREQVSVWRRRRVTELLPGAIPEPRQENPATTRVEDRMVLREALMHLGRRQRAVLVLRFYEDMTEQQVADALGISIGTVKSTVHKALARLRDGSSDLAELHGGEGR